MSLGFLLKSFSEEDKPKQADKGEISLTGILQRKRLALSRAKGPRKASVNFSPYNIGYGFCMREKVAQIAGLHEIWIKPPTPKEQLIFDIGNKYHDIVQGYFWKAGMLEGMWKCMYCWHEWWDRSPKACPECTMVTGVQYREVPLVNEDYMVSGRSDGILYLEIDKSEAKHLMDIKSISNRGAQQNYQDPRLYFEDLDTQGPSHMHVVQLMIYQWLSGIHDAHLLYVAKNGHQMKSFHIKYNETLLAPYLNTIQEAVIWAHQLKEGRRKELPPVCSSKKCDCQLITLPSQKKGRE